LAGFGGIGTYFRERVVGFSSIYFGERVAGFGFCGIHARERKTGFDGINEGMI
jgi:hypothetical protein